jgi:hypothetical protein
VRSPATRAVVGMRKTLVFYQGRAPNGVKSCWVMHEFRLKSPHTPPKVSAGRKSIVVCLPRRRNITLFTYGTLQEDWVLCRVFKKRKDSEQDNAAGSSSPPFAGSSQALVLPDQPLMMNDHCSSAGFAPPQDNSLLNAAIWQYSSVLDHQYAQEVSSSPMMMGEGCGFFYDAGFEDKANIAGMGFPQGWMD